MNDVEVAITNRTTKNKIRERVTMLCCFHRELKIQRRK